MRQKEPYEQKLDELEAVIENKAAALRPVRFGESEERSRILNEADRRIREVLSDLTDLTIPGSERANMRKRIEAIRQSEDFLFLSSEIPYDSTPGVWGLDIIFLAIVKNLS